MTVSADGLTEKLLREALEESRKLPSLAVLSLEDSESHHFSPKTAVGFQHKQDVLLNEIEKALALPKTDAEKHITEIATRIAEAENQILWCHDMLAKELTGEETATVRITLYESLKDLKACSEVLK